MSENSFTKYIQKALEWVFQIKKNSNLEKDSHALDALRVVLHQLRDNLPIIEASHFSSQLPFLIRGLYFEGWQPSQVPIQERKSISFIHSVRDNLEKYIKCSFDDTEVRKIIDAVFYTIETHIDRNELNKLYAVLPTGIREVVL